VYGPEHAAGPLLDAVRRIPLPEMRSADGGILLSRVQGRSPCRSPFDALLAALLACAHEEATQLPAEHDWEKGLDASRGPQIAPLGPIDTDQGAYNYIRRRAQERDLGSRMTAAGLDEIITSSSQVLAAAMAMPLFRAGVYYGAPRLIERACTSARRVTHAALRQTGNVDAVLQGCGAVAGPKQAASDTCADGKQKLWTPMRSWRPTSLGRGHTAADAVRSCATAARRCGALRTRSILLARLPDRLLHANDAPPHLLAGDPRRTPPRRSTTRSCVASGRQVHRTTPEGETHVHRTPGVPADRYRSPGVPGLGRGRRRAGGRADLVRAPPPASRGPPAAVAAAAAATPSWATPAAMEPIKAALVPRRRKGQRPGKHRDRREEHGDGREGGARPRVQRTKSAQAQAASYKKQIEERRSSSARPARRPPPCRPCRSRRRPPTRADPANLAPVLRAGNSGGGQ
jgi:hypothetical protein